jgi:LysM repeat protein
VPPVGAPGGAGCSHVIAAGDTFFDIAKKKGVPVDSIISLNPGVKPEALQVGQTIKVC